MTPPITLHLIAVVPALLVGTVVLFIEKGTPFHKALGRIWVTLMLVAAISSFWIFEIRDGAGPSPIHLLSIWTLIALGLAVYHIRRSNRRAHRGFMIGTYLGLIAAGIFAAAPGRLLGNLLFGG